MTIPAASQSLLGKTVGELLGDDVKVQRDGSVVGTLKHVDSYTEFSNIASEQKGNFFPVHLEKSGSKMTLKKNGSVIPGKESITFDADLVLRVENKETTFTVAVDGEDLVTLNFRKATLANE